MGMKKFGKEYRLQADSVSEIAASFESEALRISRTQDFKSRKLKPGPLLNALVVGFLALPDEEREAYAAEALARMELLLSETDEERQAATLRLVEAERKPETSRPIDTEEGGPSVLGHPARTRRMRG